MLWCYVIWRAVLFGAFDAKVLSLTHYWEARTNCKNMLVVAHPVTETKWESSFTTSEWLRPGSVHTCLTVEQCARCCAIGPAQIMKKWFSLFEPLFSATRRAPACSDENEPMRHVIIGEKVAEISAGVDAILQCTKKTHFCNWVHAIGAQFYKKINLIKNYRDEIGKSNRQSTSLYGKKVCKKKVRERKHPWEMMGKSTEWKCPPFLIKKIG